MKTPWRVATEQWLYANQLKSPEALALPDFLGIGAQKAGTSWLHENLRHHPDAFLPGVKEVHYFDDNFDQPLEEYANIFSGSGSRLRGEITPAYSILPMGKIRYIHAVMPQVRLIFLMRNPIERAWSHAIMMLVTQAGRKVENVTSGEFYEHFQSHASEERGDYEAILDRWTSIFPREQLFCGFFEDLLTRPLGLLQDVCRHIGLREDVDWERFPYRQKVYAGPGHVMPREYARFLRDQYAPKIARLAQRLGPPAARWLDNGALESQLQ